MVARSYIKSILRSVKSSLSRFVAIFAIVALGVGFLAGLLAATPDMRHSVDVYYRATGFSDLQVMGNLGMCDEDVQALAALPGVAGASPGLSIDLIAATQEGDSMVIRTHAMDMGSPESTDVNSINRSVLEAGRWPQQADECVIEYSGELLSGIQPGDTLTFTADNKDLEDSLSTTTFTVVGIVSTSYYLNLTQRGYTTVGNGRIGAIAHLPWEAYATDYYTEVNLVMAGQPLPAFSQDYLDAADALAEAVEALGETQKYVRRDAIWDDAQAQLADARDQLEEAQAEAEAELADARAKLRDGQTELDDGLAELLDGREALEEGWREYNQGVADLAQGRLDFDTEIAEAEAKLEEARLELEEARLELDDGGAQLLDGQRELDEGRAQLEENRPTLVDSRREVDEAQAQLDDALAQLADAERQLEEGQREIDENRALLEEGRLQLEEARIQLEEAEQKLLDGQNELDNGLFDYQEGMAQYAQGVEMLELLRVAIEAAQENMALIDLMLREAQNYEPEEAVQYLATFLADNADQAADIRERMASDPESVTPQEQGFLELYAALEEAMSYSDQAIDVLTDLQAEYQDADAVLAALVSQERILDAQMSDAALQLEDAWLALEAGQAEIDAGWLEYEEGKAQYLEGLAQAEDGWAQLEEGQRKLDEGRAELEENRPQLLEAQQALADGLAELEKGEADFAKAESDIADGQAELEDARAELEEGQAQYEDGLAQYLDGLAELEEGRETARIEFADAELQLRDARLQLYDAEAELADGEAQYLDGEAELTDGWIELKEAEEEVADKLQEAQDEITEAEDKLHDIESPTWYVLTRESNAGYVSYSNDSEKIDAIVRVFPIFFFLVATLVASTTMTRMVEEERGNIGTLKALGYTGGQIAAKFFLYASAAAIAGSVVGMLVGLRLFPSVIYNAYGMMYNLPPISADKHGLYGTISTVAIFIGIMLATAGAVHASLKENAASLMRPKSPPEGKRIFLERLTPIWRRMRFTHKVTARNLIRYKKRFFMTVVGIFGCTALLLCGFGLRDSISDIVSLQFGDIFTYNMSLTLKHDGDHLTDRRIIAVLSNPEYIDSYLTVHQENMRIRSGPPNDAGTTQVEVAVTVTDDPQALSGFISLRERVSGRHLPQLSDAGVYLSEKAANTLELTVGDTFTIEDSDGNLLPLRLDGIVENYVQGYLYMTEALYSQTFGQSCQYTTLLTHANDSTAQIRDTIATALLSSPNVSGVSFSVSLKESFEEMLTTIDYIVVILIISAGLLAFVVMYNLTNINITERIKELATIKVLGFTQAETAGYIFRETSILALIGALVGLVGGFFLQRFIILTVEVDNMMFGRDIKLMSYVLSLLITLAFSMIVNLFMSRKLKVINMAEALKAPE